MLNTKKWMINVILTLIRLDTSQLPRPSSIDDFYSETGIYTYDRTTGRNTGTFPTEDTYGTIIVIAGSSSNYCMQIIRPNANNSHPNVYMRFRASGSWGGWFKFTGTAVGG